MRIKKVKTKNTIQYSIIKDVVVNGKRTTKIYENLGTLDKIKMRSKEEEPLLWLKKYITELNSKEKENKIPVVIKKFPNIPITKNLQNSFNCGYLFIEKIYNDLNFNKICKSISDKHKFEFDLNNILSRLVFGRIIFPSSKLSTFELSKKFIEQPNFDLHHIYRALEIVSKEKEYIQSELYKNSLGISKRNTGILYYDCTNYFFEIDQNDDLRKYGISKEHKPNPIVGMGLFMDGDGLPLSFNIYPGNQNEQKTLIPEESKIVKNFKMDSTKMILCTDAGLASDEIKKFNIKDGRGFVITQSLKKMKSDYLNQAFDDSDWRISGDLKNIYNLNDIRNDDELKEKYYNTLFYKIIRTETKSVKQDLIVTFCFKYFDYNRNIRNSQIERAQKAIDSNQALRKGKNQNDYKRFINNYKSTDSGEIAENDNLSLDENLIENEKKYDGYYALTTNLVGDIEQILRISKGRWEIEESFRIMKSDFLARPVNLSREDRIKAHFMTCFIALFIYRLLEKKLNNQYTTSQILKTIKKMCVLETKGDGYEPNYIRTDLTDNLHEIFNFRTDYEINTYKNFKKIFEQIK